jgi:hypothetical protein
VADLHRDGFGENLVTGAQVSDKNIRAVRANLGAYVTDSFDLQFAFDLSMKGPACAARRCWRPIRTTRC